MNIKLFKKNGFSLFQTLILIIVLFFVGKNFYEKYKYKEAPKYLVDLKNAIKEFTKQKETVKDAYNEAIKAQNEAKTIKYVFKHEKTKHFIKKWKNVEKEASTLRKNYLVYKSKTEKFIDGLDDSLDRIKDDPELKKKMKDYSKAKAKIMAENIVKINSSIEQLDKSIQKGNNLIIALETVSSFNELAEDIEEFDVLIQGAGQIFDNIDSLIDEGNTVLDKELK